MRIAESQILKGAQTLELVRQKIFWKAPGEMPFWHSWVQNWHSLAYRSGLCISKHTVCHWHVFCACWGEEKCFKTGWCLVGSRQWEITSLLCTKGGNCNIYPESILELKPSLPQVRDYPCSDAARVVSAPQARSLVEHAAAHTRASFRSLWKW